MLNQTEVHALICELLFKQKISWRVPFKLLKEWDYFWWLPEELQTIAFFLESGLFLPLLKGRLTWLITVIPLFLFWLVYFVCALVMTMCLIRLKVYIKALKFQVSVSSEHRSKWAQAIYCTLIWEIRKWDFLTKYDRKPQMQPSRGDCRSNSLVCALTMLRDMYFHRKGKKFWRAFWLSMYNRSCLFVGFFWRGYGLVLKLWIKDRNW